MADLLRSTLLTEAGFAHGFSLRTGGVSEGPFASLNLGRGLGDPTAAVETNHRRFAEAVGYVPGSLFELSQVHGRRVREAEPGEDPALVRQEEGDGLFARRAGLAVGIRVADCMPVLLAHPRSGDVAAVHAGWRGVEQRIVTAAVEALGHPPAELLVAIGPHIRQARFEVGEEVAERLAAVAGDGPQVVDRSGAKPHVDLTTIVRRELAGAGVTQVDDVGGCTHADPARFFSYRREGTTGRHLAAIVARG
ncbi:MAG: multicopper polyphenol oxidase [Sandaracinus sp.]|nr:multicopper polyphenol oxidase [Sandaracinus sp.]